MAEFSWDPQQPPLSFKYAGRESRDLLTGWRYSQSSDDSHAVCHSWRDGQTGLAVTAKVRKFDDFPATDWVVELANTGLADTPIIENILPLDFTWAMDKREGLRLHWAKGSQCEIDDFLPMLHVIPAGRRRSLAPSGGRSSNGVLPFINLQRPGGGMIMAVGWSGQWQAGFDRAASGPGARLTAGMQNTHLLLHPGEAIRTPRILLMDWQGDDPEAGNNLLRRLLIAHYLPRIDGQLVLPPVAQCLQAWYYLTGDMTADFEMQAVPKVARLGADAYWIDACWYGQGGRDWWQEVGNWTINRRRYPQGLKPIADAAHDRGMRFILWFEPARVRHDGDIAKEHPEFILRAPADPDNALLNFGLPEARRHILELFSKIIADAGVDVYREDFNFDPLGYWQAADTPDRVGMTEIRYIEGHYAFWDELRRRFPRLSIDNCASGGRRIDLETMSRSLPLWPSDFMDTIGLAAGAGLDVGTQCIKAGLSRWVPLMGGGAWNFTPYATRAAMIGGFTFGLHIDPADMPADDTTASIATNDVMAKGKTVNSRKFPSADAKAAIAEWKSVRQFFLGDFHLLLPLTAAYHDWCACQFHRTDLEAGIALIFRRHRSPFDQLHLELKQIDPKASYKVSLARTYKQPPARRMTGRQLRKMLVNIPQMPGSILLRYAMIPRS